ncbi:MAG: EndoU domain-containing protein [Bacillota bacterium]|nr:EndoU domain-containing protein [Bacillota bacterium]MDW7661859.1 EndoU domain-containing protein [Bacillota bacterium]
MYQNDFETKADITYEHYTKTRVETAAEVAANNQSTIESDYGVINSDWNNNPSIKLIRTERITIHDYDNTLVKSTQTLTPINNHTNVNKDVLIGEIGKGGVGVDNSNAMKELFGIDDYEVPAGYKGVLYNNYKFANNVYDSAPIMMRLTPLLDTLIDGIELYNDSDFFTGKQLSTFDSHANKLGLLLSVIGLDIVDDIQDAKRTIKGTVKGSDELVNVASDFRKNHILYGDKTGGGHLWPGAADKSVFPKSWDADTVMHNISDIATDPNIAWQKNRVVNGVQRYEVIGVRDGVKVKVITDEKDIITAFPID